MKPWRLAALALGAVGLLAGLTVYFSTETVAPCLSSNVPRWQPPRDGGSHRFLVVFPDRAACFFAIDDGHRLVGATRLNGVRGIDAVSPAGGGAVFLHQLGGTLRYDLASNRFAPARDRTSGSPQPFARLRGREDVVAPDRRRGVAYATSTDFLGFQTVDTTSHRVLFTTAFRGFTWNPRLYRLHTPAHGLALSRDGSELWVLDGPNSFVHLFDVSGVPSAPPRRLYDVHLQKPLTGDRMPCARRCERVGSLLLSNDGRFLYVGDSGDVIDTRARVVIASLEALHDSRVQLEVDWVDGRPVIQGSR